MSNLLTRRGFTKMGLATLAASLVPSVGLAQQRGLPARLAIGADPTRLALELYLRASAPRVLVGRAIHLEGELGSSERDAHVELHPDMPWNRLSRALPRRREAGPIVFPAGEERLYARFSSLRPEGVAGEATLSVRAVLDIDPATRPAAERAGLRELAGVRARTSFTLPA